MFWGGITFFIATATRKTPELFGSKESIGVINLQGMLLSPEDTIGDLTKFRENSSIKAVLVRIDSPGGAVGASQEIYEEIKRTNKIKPVVASMGSVAASGGYYAALGANRIVANPGTLTGSIGVILKFANLEKILDKVGYKSEVIKSGHHKDIGSFSRAMTEPERLLMQSLIDNVHQQFIQAVVDSRNLPKIKVAGLADGRIYSGQQAKELGLVDQLGNFTDAVELAAELAGLSGKKLNLVYPEEYNFSLIKLLAGEKSQAALGLLLSKKPMLMYEMGL